MRLLLHGAWIKTASAMRIESLTGIGNCQVVRQAGIWLGRTRSIEADKSERQISLLIFAGGFGAIIT